MSGNVGRVTADVDQLGRVTSYSYAAGCLIERVGVIGGFAGAVGGAATGRP